MTDYGEPGLPHDLAEFVLLHLHEEVLRLIGTVVSDDGDAMTLGLAGRLVETVAYEGMAPRDASGRAELIELAARLHRRAFGLPCLAPLQMPAG